MLSGIGSKIKEEKSESKSSEIHYAPEKSDSELPEQKEEVKKPCVWHKQYEEGCTTCQAANKPKIDIEKE